MATSTNDKAIIEKLKAHTDPSQVKQRPAKGSSGKLAYVDARYVMDRLDDAVGPFGWQDNYREVDGGNECTILISLDGNAWVGKSDVGTPSQIEGVKGKFSDAFKRAAVKWGIGRDLYDEDSEVRQAVDEVKPKAKSASPSPVEGLTEPQRKKLFAALKKNGLEGAPRKALVMMVTKKHSVKQMDSADLDKVLEVLDNPTDEANEGLIALAKDVETVGAMEDDD